MDDRRELDFLAGEHQKMISELVEAVISEVPVGLGIEERNALGISVRFHAETVLVPGVLAVTALLLGAGPDVLNRDLPRWIERVSSVLPADAQVLTEAGRQVDPAGYALLEENLGLAPDQCLGVEMFHSYLLGLTPCITKGTPNG